ncbi:MAG: DUF4417 domain-containing protein [Ruminococcus sp.]|nr:DUF4417 domain-containing protein [Ruminococcus sp.]
MVKDATFTEYDIPFCPTKVTDIPKEVITYKEAKEIYRKELNSKSKDFKNEAYVCFYEDDYDFDSSKGIWFNSKRAFEILNHFAGIFTPDFSTYQDFPYPLKIWNTYRMRAFGYYYGKSFDGGVVNNLRWGTPESYAYCFNGVSKNSIVAIGTVGGSPRKQIDRDRFENGLREMVHRLQPHTILVYGSANYPCFHELKEKGIKIVSYPSKTAKAFERRKNGNE